MNTKPLNILAGVAGGLLAGWTAWSYFFARGIEKPRYRVLGRRRDYEVRTYEPYVAAEIDVPGDYYQAFGRGFSALSGYISGNNMKRNRLAGFVPVSECRRVASARIAMTAPVTERMKTDAGKAVMTAPPLERGSRGELRTIAFVMPAAYTLDMLPEPVDPAIRLREVPSRQVAALRFSGYPTPRRVEQKKRQLLAELCVDHQRPVAEPEFAAYNPPFTVPFLMRNEVMIQME